MVTMVMVTLGILHLWTLPVASLSATLVVKMDRKQCAECLSLH